MSPPPPTSPRSCSRTHSAFRKGDDAEKKRIVIIGAGLSSLALVNVLQNDSKRISEIIILEAKNDIGGTWNPNQCYHNLQTHGVRAGFDLLPWDRFDSPYDHAHHRDVHSAMKNFFQKDSIPIFSSFFVEEEESTHYKRKDDEVPSSPPSLPSKPLGSHNDEKKNVETKVYLSTRVKSMEWQKTSSSSSSRVKLNIFSDGEEQTRELFADFVIYTGTTHQPKVPEFNQGKDKYTGEILAAADVDSNKFEEILERKLKVVILGGSKAAMDTVWNFNQRGYTSLVWMFRRTYWGTNFAYFQSSFMNKTSLFARWRKILQYLFMKVRLDFDSSQSSWISRAGLFILAKVGYILNPFDAKTYDLGNFHGAIIEPERMQPYRNTPNLRGEIDYVEGKKLYTTKGLGVHADVIICCTGYDNPKVPILLPNGSKLLAHEESGDKFWKGMVAPSVPHVLFMNTFSLGNILHDATTVGCWLRACYFPQLFDSPIESTISIIQKGLDDQNEEMKRTKCRSYDLWNSFDRPVQYMYYCGRTFEKEIYETDLLACSGKRRGFSSVSSPIRRWLYSWSCASFLLADDTNVN
tara:strand:+ start:211 stop:1944 length:1734 start_codon:yes stop_codon:yes gene_type:complete